MIKNTVKTIKENDCTVHTVFNWYPITRFWSSVTVHVNKQYSRFIDI